MFKIGEFSKLTQVSIRMLRYYDEMGLIKPAQIDASTGYRMYSANQIPLLNRIFYLRDSGFLIQEISELLHAPENIQIERLNEKQKQIQKTIQEDQEKLKKIEIAKKGIQTGNSDLHNQILIKPVPSCLVLSIRKRIPTYYHESELWKELCIYAMGQKIEVSDKTFSIYHDTEYEEKNVDVEVCAPAEKLGEGKGAIQFREIEPTARMAYTMVYGDFSNIAGAYQSMAKWLEENSQYQMAGQTRQIVHRGPWNEPDPENYVVEIQIPLK